MSAQPSLLKKGCLFGKSVAVSSDNGDEVASSQVKDEATESNTSGDHQDEGEANAAKRDANEKAHGDDEEMTVDETPEDKDGAPAEDAKTPSETVDTDAVDCIQLSDDEDVQFLEPPKAKIDETKEHEEIQVNEPAKKDDEEKESPESPEKEETAVEEEKKEEVEEVEEVCDQKVIPMDTHETEETPGEGKTDESRMDEDMAVDAEKEEAEPSTDAINYIEVTDESAVDDEVQVLEPPKKDDEEKEEETASDKKEETETEAKIDETKEDDGIQAVEPAKKDDEEKEEDKESPEKDETAVDEEKKEEIEEVEEVCDQKVIPMDTHEAEKTPAEGKTEDSTMEEEKAVDSAEKEEEEVEAPVVATPKRGRGRPPKAASVKREEEQAVDAEKDEGTPVVATPKRGRGRPPKSASVKVVDGRAKSQATEEEEVAEKRGRGRPRKSASGKTPTASAKKARKGKEEEETETEGDSSATESMPFDESTAGEEEEEAPLVTPKRGRGRPRKSASGRLASVKKEGKEGEGATPKRGPGRPPKSASSRKTSVKSQATTVERGEEKMDSDEEEEEMEKKGRGRGRKSASGKKPSEKKEEGETETEGEDEGMDTTPAMARRGRGRPPGSGVSVGRKRKAASPVSSASSFMGEASVKRPPRNVVEIPELDAEAQLAADHPVDESANLVPGARVYAVFQKVFYPALVGERDGFGRYMVEFVEDKIIRPVPPAGVVPLAAVTIDKECLFQLTPDDEPIECSIHRSIDATNAKEWQEGVFKVVNNDGDELEAVWTQLQLDLATPEWKKYVNMMTKKATKIDADNIASSSDKRDRRSRVFNDPAVDVATPGPTARRSLTRKTPSASVELMPTASPPKTKPLTLRDILGTPPYYERVEAAAVEDDSAAEDAASVEYGASVEDAAKEDEEDEEEGAESVESESSDAGIFFDQEFILTSANRTIDFPKGKLKRQIRERGGVVLENIHSIVLDDEPVLIADAPCRTAKYIGALARGIPCVHKEWLVECVKQEQLLPYDNYKLPAGKGLLDDELHPLPDVRDKLLAGRSIIVHSTKEAKKAGEVTFKELWCPLVDTLGGSLVADAPLENWTSASSIADLPDFDLLLTDSSCQLEIVTKLEAAGKAVVSSEWLIQSIITGRILEFSAHRRFRFDSGKEKTGDSQEQPTTSQES